MKEKTISELIKEYYAWSVKQGFWVNKNDDEMDATVKIMLIVTELSEAVEAIRKGNWDGEHGFNEEMADATIRLFDLCGRHNIDLYQEMEKKMIKNRQRPHKHGKKF